MESLKQRLEKVIETKYSVYDAMYVFEKDILDRQQIAIHFADTDICPEKPCKSNHAMNYILGICRNDFSDMNLYFKTKCEESHDHEEEPWITLSDWEFRLGLRNNDESNEEDEDMPDLEPESDDEDDDENEQPPKYTRVEYARKKPQDKREKVDVETNTNKDENRKRKVPNNLDADTIPGETDYAKIMLSDQALAHLAWKNIRTNVVIVDEQGNGYVFSELSMLWEPMIAKQIKLYLCNQIKKIIEKDETYTIREKCDISVKVMSSAGINGVFNFFSAMAYDNTFEKRLNAHISTLPIARGLVVDLKTGKTRKRTRADMYTFAIPCEMEDLEDPETIEKMEEFKNKILMPIFGDNVDMVEFIRMLFGYCMTGEKDERALFIFYGERGANGKGTLMEFMELILGQLYDVVPKEIFISSLKAAQGAATPHLSELQGIRLGTYSETEKEELLNAAVLKSLVSEGDLTKSRDLYSKRYKKFQSVCKLILQTNHKPKINAQDEALVDRLIMIPFEKKFVDHPYMPHHCKRDRALIETYKHDLLDIVFTTFVSGAVDWYKLKQDGIRLRTKLPEVAQESTQTFVLENDTIKQFISDCCEIGAVDTHSVTGSVFQKSYSSWCDTTGNSNVGKNEFGIVMKKLFKSKKKGTVMTYFGVRINPNFLVE